MKWIDQRKRELEQIEFEQYWKLINVSQESTFIVMQNVSLLLLRRFPDYKHETVAFLNSRKSAGGNWVENNRLQIEEVLRHFKAA